MTTCVRECRQFRRHDRDRKQDPCPVPDGQQGAWVNAVDLTDEQREHLRSLDDDDLAATDYQINRYGGVEEWLECNGCKPRQAEHGLLCEPCHVRLSSWILGTRSLVWAYQWIAPDLEPGQGGASDKIRVSRTPPLPLSASVHDLRQDILAAYAQWLGMICGQFDLTGPAWWRYRIDQARTHTWTARQPDQTWQEWADANADRQPTHRAWLPQTLTELVDAARFVDAWLSRVEGVPDLIVAIYDRASKLHRQVKTTAPWEAKATRIPDRACPHCDREALVRWDGDEHLTCRRCKETVDRKRYDVWAYGSQQEASVA